MGLYRDIMGNGKENGSYYLGFRVEVRRTPHPVIVRETSNCIRVLLYSYYTTITGLGVLLSCTRVWKNTCRLVRNEERIAALVFWTLRGQRKNPSTHSFRSARKPAANLRNHPSVLGLTSAGWG